jgi:hypothetical protein
MIGEGGGDDDSRMSLEITNTEVRGLNEETDKGLEVMAFSVDLGNHFYQLCYSNTVETKQKKEIEGTLLKLVWSFGYFPKFRL